jgi:hypothetical protein
MGIFEILDLRGCQNRKSHFWGEKKSAFTEKTIFGDKKGQRSPKTDARARKISGSDRDALTEV